MNTSNSNVKPKINKVGTVGANNVIINLEKLNAKVLPETDIKRCIAKALQQFSRDSMPAMIESFGDLSDVVPSNMNYVACMTVINSYVKENKGLRHPVYLIDSLIQETDVVIKSGGITYGSETVPSMMGMVATNAHYAVIGATSTLLSFCTKENVKGDVDKVITNKVSAGFAGIPMVDMLKPRNAIRTMTASPLISRDAMYTAMSVNDRAAVSIIDQVYATVPQYSHVNEDGQKAMMKLYGSGIIKFLPTGCGPTVMNPVVTVANDKITFMTMWALVNISRGMRGEDKAGIGSLTAGYYLYDMPPTYAKAIARSKETLFLCRAYGFIAVSVPAGCKDYSMLYTQILVANGISVITANGTKVHTSSSVPAVYGRSKVETLFIIPNAFGEPSMTRSGVSMNQEGFNDKAATFVEDFDNGARVMYTYYTPNLQILAEKKKWLDYVSYLFSSYWSYSIVV